MRLPAVVTLLVIATLACNLERVIDPSLPTSIPEATAISATSSPTPEEIKDDTNNVDALEDADRAFFYGDWDSAFDAYEAQFTENTLDDVRSDALLGMARVEIKRNEWTNARRLIAQLQSDFPDSQAAKQSPYFLALVNEQLDNFGEAAIAYEQYLLENSSSLSSIILEWRGDALKANGDYTAAIDAYQQASNSPRLGNTESIQVKIGDTYFLAGNYPSAILTYQNVFINSNNDYLKSQMDLSMGRAYIALDQSAEAYPLYLDAVEHYPLAFSSYAALVELVNAGELVGEYDRGLVDYYAAASLEASGDFGGAAELYSVAIAAFDRYLLANEAEHESSAHHFRALSLRALDDYEGAIQEWQEIIDGHGFEDYWAEAYAQKAFTEWAFQDDFDQGIDTLLSFVAKTPSQDRSAEFLFTAAQIAERDFQLDYAIELFERVSSEYPNSDYAYRSLFKAGINFYRLNLSNDAESLFRRANDAAIDIEDRAQALFWVAKMEALNGNVEQSLSTYAQTSEIDPSGYYSERAADLLAGLAPFTYTNQISLEPNLESEKVEAENWMRSVFSLEEGANLSGLGALSNDERILRGEEYWRLGEYELARAEFENLRLSFNNDSVASYQLANYFIDLGVYRSGIFAARQVLSIAGMGDAESLDAPAYFNRLRFGLYFEDLVLPEAEKDKLDPLFVLSVIRQESLFEGFVTSSAGARGLMQIIPSTGQEIADLSGWPPDYSAIDLYRPIVSISFGTDYLERQSNTFDGDLYAALAAYNAGSGWAAYWISIANSDQDLFLELIHFPESKDYIRSIYEIFRIYVDLYSID